jgi:hypothetical protein
MNMTSLFFPPAVDQSGLEFSTYKIPAQFTLNFVILTMTFDDC